MFKLAKGSICPQCEKGRLKEIKKDLRFEYKEREKIFSKEKVLVCNLCNYEGLTRDTSSRIEKELTDFRRSVTGLLTSDQMKAIREGLGLNKKEMAVLLALNEKTVGRYESGKITQSDQIDRLYRIYKKYPSIARQMSEQSVSLEIEAQVTIKALGSETYTYDKKGPKWVRGEEYAKAA